MRATCTDSWLSQPTAQSKGAAAFGAAFWGGALDGELLLRSSSPTCKRASLMHGALTGAVLGVARTSVQQLLGAWNFMLSRRCLRGGPHASNALAEEQGEFARVGAALRLRCK